MNDIQTILNKITNEKIENSREIFGGTTNKITLINNKFVIREPLSCYDKFNSYKFEGKIIAIMQNKSITEKVLYFDNKSGIKISNFIQETHHFNYSSDHLQIKKIIKIIKNLHELNCSEKYEFNVFERLSYYKSFSEEFIQEKYENNLIDSLKISFFSKPFVLSHNDLVSGNILLSDKKVFLIDFEFAGYNHPYFDLASLISENNISIEDSIKIIKEYFGKEFNLKILSEIQTIEKLQNILWFYWAQKRYKETGKKIFLEIKENKKTMIDQDIIDYYHS